LASNQVLKSYSILWRLATSVILVMGMSKLAFAHGDGQIGGGFGSGFSHPIQGMDHVVAMIAVGLWGAQLGTPAIWFLPIAFPLMMALGAAISLMGFPLPGVEIGIACSAMVLGAMVLMEVKLPIAATLAIVGVFAIFHGHAHGTELPDGESGVAYSLGFVLGTGLLHAVGIGVGYIGEWPSGKIILRGAGALVMSSGIYFLLKSLGTVA
jgi:urease accessory protein